MNTSPKLLIITIIGLVGYWTIPSVLFVVITYQVEAGVKFSREFETYFGMALTNLCPIILNPVTVQPELNLFNMFPGMTFAIVITSGISLGWIAYGSYRLIKRVNRFRDKVNNP